MDLEFGRARRDRSPPSVVVENYQLSTMGIDDDRSRFLTHQERSEIVPGAVRVGTAVDERVERSVGHCAHVERDRAKRPKLAPTKVAGREARQPDERIGQIGDAARVDGLAVAPCALASNGVIPPVVHQVDHQGDNRPVAIDRTQTGGVPGDAVGGVGRSVEGVDHHGDLAIWIVATGLFAEYADATRNQPLDRNVIGRDVAEVLALSGSGQPPVVERPERRADQIGNLVQQIGQHLGLSRFHRRQPSREPRRPGSLFGVAAIDVPVFIADLKDHAVDHGFHVHDERHFVETYSLRQAWEVDLHPEEACGGPLDLHLALEVDPRVMLGFEDAILDLPESDDPPDVWSFPLLFTWALPPLPKGPDLLVLATELAGIGGPDLPLDVSAIDSTASATEATERSLSIVGRIEVSLARIFLNQEQLCDTLDRCLDVSRFLLDQAPIWLDE